MYISKKELLKIATDNKLRGCVDYTKPQLFTRLRSEGLLPEGVNENDKDSDRYNFLKGIKDRTNQGRSERFRYWKNKHIFLYV